MIDINTMHISESPLTPALRTQIFEGFKKAAIDATGIDGLSEEPIVFQVQNDETVMGCIVAQPFWGQLHIKYLFVIPEYRRQGIASALIEHALDFARSKGCTFVFVETMNFLALEFYQKRGFVVEFSRFGFDKDSSMHYLKRDL